MWCHKIVALMEVKQILIHANAITGCTSYYCMYCIVLMCGIRYNICCAGLTIRDHNGNKFITLLCQTALEQIKSIWNHFASCITLWTRLEWVCITYLVMWWQPNALEPQAFTNTNIDNAKFFDMVKVSKQIGTQNH